MKILFTGSSSFTGYWFIKELVNSGHEVIATFTGNDIHDYQDIRFNRVKNIINSCRSVFRCKFGDDSFLKLIQDESNIDILCHHGADVTNYKSNDFDVVAALANNTYRIQQVFQQLEKKNCRSVVLTGSVFEGFEGSGTEPLLDFSPYGLSKRLTADVLRYYSHLYGLGFGKFVIPNPFGPLEEKRFTYYLMNQWKSNNVASVKTPAYVRDNIHVSLLAKVYSQFVNRACHDAGKSITYHPSQYVETQGAFTKRYAEEMKKRLEYPCLYDLQEQSEFPEPKVRINTDIIDQKELNWSEELAWNEIADYYREMLSDKQ